MASRNLIHHNPARGADLFSELWNAPFFRAAGIDAPAARFVPQIDAVETDQEYRITAELPGLEEKDFEVVLEDGVLTLKGEKRGHSETTEEGEGKPAYRRVETSWGRFERRLRFDAAIEEDKVSASYKNGVLTVVVPKPAEVRPQVRTIPVQSA